MVSVCTYEELGLDLESDLEDLNPRPQPIWGWGFHKKMAAHDATAHKGKHVSEFKLLLDESEEAKGLRTQAYKDLRAMSLMKLAHTPVDIIADYLERLLKHTKDQLTEFHGLRDENPVEFVLCVPVKWSYKASWRMQEAMHRAIEASGLGRLDNGGIKGLFIVSEPEAASTFVISQSDSARFLNLGETIVLLDCGGGTVDAITYKVIQTDPVRLREVVPPNGASCGSVFLNKNFEELLRDRLQGATLLGNAISLDHIIKTKLVEWENLYKRTIDITARKGSEKFNMLHIHGLQTDESRRIRDNCVLFDRSEIKDVFKGCLRDVHKLLRDQLRRAKEATDEDTGGLGFNVQRVFMVGGFAESPSLQSHIRDVLSRERNVLGQPIRLVLPRHVDSAVARGAVLRALNKEDGPRRFTRISYGIIRSNLYDPDLPEHQGLRGRIWAVDGQLYIEKCIHWQILVVGCPFDVAFAVRILTVD